MDDQRQDIQHSQLQNSKVQLGNAETQNQFQNSDNNQVTQIFVNEVGQKQQSWDRRQRKILEQVQADVNQRLTDGLNNDRLIVLGMSPTLKAVDRSPLKAPKTLDIPTKVTTSLEPDLPIVQVFLQPDISGKLLILGAPGMGKTTTLLTLAKALIAESLKTPGTTLPIVFELSAWTDDGQSIDDWLVAQLKERYNLSPEEGKTWLEDRVLLPLLDGLDELGARQAKCIDKINAFAQAYPHVVVCCRTEEYYYLSEGKMLGTLRGAVCLHPLTDEQIKAYLTTLDVGELWIAVTDSLEMAHMLEPDEDGKPGILRVPLLLSMAAVAYEGEPFADRTVLYRTYVDQRLAADTRRMERKRGQEQWAYGRLEQEPSRQQTKQTLAWMARQLSQRNQVELLIERIQPRWLEDSSSRQLYRLIVGLIVGLLLGLLFGLLLGLLLGLIVGLIVGLFFGLFSSREKGEGDRSLGNKLINWLFDEGKEIEPVEAFNISMSREVRREILKNFRKGLIVGLIGGLILGLILGLIVGLIGGLKQELQLRSRPNQGIHNSLQSLMWTTVFSYPLGVVSASLSTVPRLIADGLTTGDSIVVVLDAVMSLFPRLLIPGIFGALLFGFLMGGGMEVVQHFCLRFVLWQRGIAPWDLPRFLNYCVERRLLQRVGGRYRFLHRELLDYFARESF